MSLPHLRRRLVTLCLIFLSFRVFCQPVITSFSPGSGPVGTLVTINGSGFNTTPANNIVFFGAVRATVVSASATFLSVQVPTGVTHSPLTVTTNGLTAYSNKPFIVTFSGGGRLTGASLDQGVVLPTDLHPNGIAVADFDGDGKPDMATANNYSSSGSPASISILRNTSSLKNISFAPAQKIPNGVLTYAIASGDLDGDGKPDLVCSSIVDQAISIYRNNSTPGTISFAPKTDLPAGDNTYSIAIADFDGDGKPDIVFTNALSNSISIYKNTGSIGTLSFGARQNIFTGLEPMSLAVNDFDGDNKPDVAVANGLSKSISIFKNTSSTTISFAARIDIVSGNDNPDGITAGDLDGDGRSDLVVTNNNLHSTSEAAISFSIFKNLSSGGSISFGSRSDYATGDTYQPALADLNGDGKPDLVIPSYKDGLSIYENKSSSGLLILGSINRFGGASPYYAGISDYDGDEKPDIAVANFTFDFITVYRNRVTEPGILSFTPPAAAAGETITLKGVHFTNTSSVTIGGINATSFTVVNDSTITAVVGVGSSDSISVTGPEGTAFVSGFTRILPPVISSFTPTLAGAGTSITITGAHLNYVTSVSFGGVPASFTIVDETTIKAVVATGASGAVSVTSNGGTASLAGFVFIPPPVITSFTPTSGIEGTKVTITGHNFISVNSVAFGNILAQYQVVSPDTIIAFVGKGATGCLTITTNYGTGSLCGFVYLVPTITSFTPTQGPGGTTVTITGTNFINVSEVKFGGTGATSFTVISNTTIEAVVSEGASGDVLVTTSYGTASLSGFTHTGPPVLNGFSPASGGPGTIVLINGNNFTHTTEVSFGGVKADSFHVISTTQIMAIVGTGASGAVRVTTSFGFAEKAGFSFYPLPTISGFSPRVGSVGTSVKITGNHFDPLPQNNIVYFGAVKAPVVSATDSSVIVTVPAGADYQPVTVNVHGLVARSAYPFAVTFGGGGTDFTSHSIGQRLDYPAMSSRNKKGFSAKDLDGDGKPELITSGYSMQNITVMHNVSTPGAISFQWPITAVPTDFSPTSLAVADLDGDGKQDLATVNEFSNSVSLIKNKSIPGTLDFEQRMTLAVGANTAPDCIAIADLDGDGRPDIITNGGALKLFGNTSDGSSVSFGPRIDFNNQPAPLFVTTGDLDGDGKEDLVTLVNDYVFYVHRNTGSPGRFAFAAPISFPAGDNLGTYMPSYISIEDLDGDGKKELVLLNIHAVTIFKNKSTTGQIVLEKVSTYSLTSTWADAMTIADIDGDTKPEIIINDKDHDKVGVYRNTSTQGTISFAAIVKWETIEGPGTTAVCDLDADGKPELCMTQSDSRAGVAVWQNMVGTSLPCMGSNVVLTSILKGNQYQWQEFGSGGYVNILDTGYYSGTTTMQLKIANAPGVLNNRYYRCFVDGTPVSGWSLEVADTTSLKAFMVAPATTCSDEQFTMKFSGLPKLNMSAVTELWESKNGGAFQVIDSKIFTGDTLAFYVSPGSSTSVNKYFFKFKAPSACTSTVTSDTSTVTVTRLDPPPVTINNLTLSVSNPDLNAVYQWEQLTGIVWNLIATGTSYSIINSGTYRVKIIKGNCFAYSENKSMIITAVDNVNADRGSMVLYPNQTDGLLTIDSLKLADKWSVLEIVSSQTGQTILHFSAANKTSLTVNVKTLSEGTYLAVLRRKDGSWVSMKFMKL
jgi:hypothetical protein